MTFNWRFCAAIAVGGASLLACDKTSESGPAAAAVSANLTDDDVPVAEDYITKATEEVRDDNYAAELDKLEKEIK